MDNQLFKVVAQKPPMEHQAWFEGFENGSLFEAESLEIACEMMESQCVSAGTYFDPNYKLYGPKVILIADMGISDEPEKIRLDKVVQVIINCEEYHNESWHEAATAEGLSFNSWVIKQLDAAAATTEN